MWIVKDSCWFFALHYPEHEVPLSIVSFVFAVPTILISFYLVAKSESRFLLAENLLITLWLCANTGWMASELFKLNVSLLSVFFFSAGILLIPLYLTTLFKKQKIKL